jgi:ribosomal protein S18 acetylase RimI-like enzyme
VDIARLFAEYRPRPGAEPAALPETLLIRDAVPADLAAMARIAQERNGGDVAAHEGALERQMRDGSIVLAAAVGGRVVGYGKAGVFTPPADAPGNCAPAGWYLTGVTVAPEMRRRGIGLELTRARLARVGACADRACYFANALNRASIDLHARLGFVEVTRDFWFPGTTFTGGVGILFRAALAPEPGTDPTKPIRRGG